MGLPMKLLKGMLNIMFWLFLMMFSVILNVTIMLSFPTSTAFYFIFPVPPGVQMANLMQKRISSYTPRWKDLILTPKHSWVKNFVKNFDHTCNNHTKSKPEGIGTLQKWHFDLSKALLHESNLLVMEGWTILWEIAITWTLKPWKLHQTANKF